MLLHATFLLLWAASSDMKAPEWETLQVTWAPPNSNSDIAFDTMPRIEADALRKGWLKVSDCGDTSKFAGRRYVKDGDTAVVLIYDVNGYIAGIQAGFESVNGYPHASLLNEPFVEYNGKQYITAYFVEPSSLCSTGRTAKQFAMEGTGTDLWIQTNTSPNDSHRVPRQESGLSGTLWTKGRCYTTMGQHYWYDARLDAPCDNFFPVFLLYNGGRLDAFGWSFMTTIASPRFEYPPNRAFGYFLDPVPRCLSKHTAGVTTLHIFLSNPRDSIC
ncbi:uncharacterized protein LOC124252952 [Haliotis rubra]|uniref:uncharacterized protein LOC124252952 n=1 Tax=Haliotis rubra TaxID=36100 RepID=UPI001EE588DF|nr:uncharacterized protein LOC124252952 [Haliotis rubra]